MFSKGKWFSMRQIEKKKSSNLKCLDSRDKLNCPDLLINQGDQLSEGAFCSFLQIWSEVYCSTGRKSSQLHICKESYEVEI